MGDCGLILWENEALPLISSFRPVSDQKKPKIYRKTPDKPLFDYPLLATLYTVTLINPPKEDTKGIGQPVGPEWSAPVHVSYYPRAGRLQASSRDIPCQLAMYTRKD